MNNKLKKWGSIFVVGAMLCSTASALDLSLDNYYDVAKEKSTKIKTNNASMSLSSSISHTSQTIAAKALTDMSLLDANEQLAHSTATMLITYYDLLLQKSDLENTLLQMKAKVVLMEKMYEKGTISLNALNDLKLGVEDLGFGLESLNIGIENLEMQIANSLQTEVSDLKILDFVSYKKETLDDLKKEVEGLKNYNLAKEKSNSLKIQQKKLAMSNPGTASVEDFSNPDKMRDLTSQSQAIERQNLRDLELSHKLAYETLYNDVLRSITSLKLSINTFEKKASDFKISEKKYEIGTLSKIDLESARLQLEIDKSKVTKSNLTLKQNIIKLKAFNDGVWIK